MRAMYCECDRLGFPKDAECMYVDPCPTRIQAPDDVAARARADKLDTHHAYAEPALSALVQWMCDEPGLIIAAARGRHAEGSIRYGDRLMYEYDDATLRAEALQELADAVNYFVVLLSRESKP